MVNLRAETAMLLMKTLLKSPFAYCIHSAGTIWIQTYPPVELIMLLCGALDNCSIRMLEMSCGKKGGWVHI